MKSKRSIDQIARYIPNCQPVTNLIKSERGTFSERVRLVVIEQMVRALHYMHSNNLVHRDIKSDNVVYSATKEDVDLSKLELKLIDFGFSQVSKKGHLDLKDFVGTPYYIAPEIVKGKMYGSKCDIWSLGVLAFQLISGEFPFIGRNRAELFKNIKAGRYNFKSPVWDSVTPSCREFINSCLKVEPSERSSAEELLKCKWFELDRRSLQDYKDAFCDRLMSHLRQFERMNSLQWTIIKYMSQLNLL